MSNKKVYCESCKYKRCDEVNKENDCKYYEIGFIRILDQLFIKLYSNVDKLLPIIFIFSLPILISMLIFLLLLFISKIF